MRIANGVIDLIGRTPLMALHKLQQAHELYANLIAKVESMNPAGSAKDRIARQMILDAEEKGLQVSVWLQLLRRGGTAPYLPCRKP